MFHHNALDGTRFVFPEAIAYLRDAVGHPAGSCPSASTGSWRGMEHAHRSNRPLRAEHVDTFAEGGRRSDAISPSRSVMRGKAQAHLNLFPSAARSDMRVSSRVADTGAGR